MKKSSADNGPNKGNLEEVFRHGLGQGEVTPRGDLWGRIDQQLDQQAAGKSARRAGYLALLNALILLITGSVLLFRFWPDFAAKQMAAETGKPSAGSELVQGPLSESGANPHNDLQAPNNAAPQGKLPANAELLSGSHPSGNLSQVVAEPGTANQNSKPSLKEESPRPGTLPNVAKTSAANKNAVDKIRKNVQSAGRKRAATAAQLSALAIAATPAGTKKPAAATHSKTSDRDDLGTGNGKVNAAAGQAVVANSDDKSANQNLASGDPVLMNPDNEAVTAPTTIASNTQQNSNEQAPAGPENAPSADSVKQQFAIQPVADSSAKPVLMPEPKKPGRWVISAAYAGYQFEQGLVISPVVPATSQPIDYSDITRYRQAAQEFNELTKPSSSYRIEIRAGYKIKDRLRIDAGLSYANNKSVTENTYLVQSFVQDENGSMQLVDESSVLEPVVNKVQRDSVAVRKGPGYETTYQYRFVAVPVRLVYQSDTDGWHWFASGGISGGMLLGSSVQSTRANTDKEKLGNDAAFRKWQASGLFSFGLGYQITDRISLQAGPDLSYSFNSLMGSRRTGVKQKNPYTVGLSGGVSFTIK